jgi:hypothetical protein
MPYWVTYLTIIFLILCRGCRRRTRRGREKERLAGKEKASFGKME